MSSEAERKMQFLFALRSKGITDQRVLSAMEKIDRGFSFVDCLPNALMRICRSRLRAGKQFLSHPSWV